MNDDLEPLDETLARGLGALAPSDLDADRALGALRPAFRRARLRRRVATSTTALGVVAAVVAGVVAVQGHPSARVDIRGGVRPTVSTPDRTQPTAPRHVASTSTSSPARHTIGSTTVPAHSRPTPGPGSAVAGPHPAPLPIPTVTSPPPPSTTPPGRDHGGTTTTMPAPAASTHTYDATGGRVTIRFSDGRLTLVSEVAAPGYSVEIHTNAPDDIEVRFSNGDRESRIRIRVQDGALQPEIREN